jgi:hypothetical protein
MARGFRTYLGSGTNLAERIDIWFPGAPDFTPTSGNVPGLWVTYPTRIFFTKGLAVRTAVDPMALAPTIRQTIERLGPRRPVTAVRPLDDCVSDASADARFALFVLGALRAVRVDPMLSLRAD